MDGNELAERRIGIKMRNANIREGLTEWQQSQNKGEFATEPYLNLRFAILGQPYRTEGGKHDGPKSEEEQ